MEEDIQQWVEQAGYDLETARAMCKTGRYLYVLFTCQQAMEKLIKAHVIKVTRQFPPRTHDLIKLIDVVNIQIEPDQKELLRHLSSYYIKTRYPEEIRRLGKDIDNDLALSYLNKTEELFLCLKQKLKL